VLTISNNERRTPNVQVLATPRNLRKVAPLSVSSFIIGRSTLDIVQAGSERPSTSLMNNILPALHFIIHYWAFDIGHCPGRL
jgi:hypothetical protein